MNYLQELRKTQRALAEFDATLAPGETFTYRFTAVGEHNFYLYDRFRTHGQGDALGGTAILRHPARPMAKMASPPRVRPLSPLATRSTRLP
ncbi:MAG: hypothetical protein R3E79_28720 [Caldilineaceae bacterium]